MRAGLWGAALLCVMASACTGDRVKPATQKPPSPTTTPAESPGSSVADGPDGNITVMAREWSFSAPSQVVAGPTRITLDNVGTVPHELVLVEPEAGRSLADIRLLPHVDAMASVRWIAGSGLVHEGQVSTPLQVDLRPGTYGFLCMLDGPGQTHAKTGMFLEFEVVSA